MLKNYFKTAFRNLIRNRNYTIINIAGLNYRKLPGNKGSDC